MMHCCGSSSVVVVAVVADKLVAGFCRNYWSLCTRAGVVR